MIPSCSPLKHPFLSLLLASGLVTAGPARAQAVVIHDGFAADDGNAERDADRTLNGVTVWDGNGMVHVVRKGFEVRNGERLVIRRGAIVKFAYELTLDADGDLLAAEPTKDGYLRTVFNTIDSDQRRPSIEIEGALLTDIRDDTVGGDTNRDGAATTPTWLAFELGFSGSASRVSDSIIRFGWIDRAGFATILRNRFDYFGGICPRATFEDVGGAPVVSDNTFNLAYPAGCGELDFRGASPVVTGNTIRTVAMVGYVGEFRSTGLVIGPCCVFDPQGPLSGTTIVAYNNIHARTAIRMPWQAGSTMYEAIDFRARIIGNVLHGVANAASASTGDDGLMLVLEADVRVERNTISNFRNPLVLQATGASLTARPVLRENTFGTGGISPFSNPALPDAIWRAGVTLDAERNDWGDPTGPQDPSAIDGLSNARGRGLRLGHGIDYAPFLGLPGLDRPSILIEATAGGEPALAAGSDVTITPGITELNRGPSPGGSVRLVVRDDEGIAIRSGSPVSFAAGSIPIVAPVNLTVPSTTRFLAAEVEFAHGSGTVTSNPVYFAVDRPESRLGFKIGAPGTTNPVRPIVGPARGVTARFTASMAYELPGQGGGRIEVDMEEIDQRTGKDIASPLVTPSSIRVPNTLRGSVQADMTVKLPLRDVIADRRPAALRVRLRLRDVSDRVVSEEWFRLVIDESSNYVAIRSYAPGAIDGNGFVVTGASYFATGARPDGQLTYALRAGAPNAPHLWQVFRETSALDATGRTLARWAPTVPLKNFFNHTLVGESILVAHDTPLPSGSVRVREKLWIWSPYYRIVLAVDTLDVEVREVATRQSMALPPAGTNRLAFSGTPVTLDLTARPAAGSVMVDEFRVSWTGESPAPFERILTPAGFRPIRRHWSVWAVGSGTWEGTISFGYDPTSDLPDGMHEDSLVVAAVNPLSGSLEILATTRDPSGPRVSAPYERSFETWVVGSIQRSTVANEPGDVPGTFRLDPAYPNPFNPATTIPFSVSVAGPVRLSIYDALGRHVADLVDATLPAGAHSAAWVATGRASGAYWIRLVSAGEIKTRAVVLLR